MAQLIRRHALVTFFLLAFGITWVVWMPRAAGAPLGVLGRAWTWAPAIAALLTAVLTGGLAAVRELAARLVRWRVGWQWYLVVILGPAVFSLAVADVHALLGGSWSAATPRPLREGSLVLLPFYLLILALTDGLGEDLAWRGFALPRLLSRRATTASSSPRGSPARTGVRCSSIGSAGRTASPNCLMRWMPRSGNCLRSSSHT